MPCRCMNALAKSFELSSCAAARVGPKIAGPLRGTRRRCRRRAALRARRPSARSRLSRANGHEVGDRRVSATLASARSRAVPALPGATNTLRDARALRDLPRQRMLAAAAADDEDVQSVPEVADAGEDHRDAALVGRGDHFGVAHAAAGLDHGGGAVVGDDVEPVAKREESVGGDRRARERQAGVLRLDRGDARANRRGSSGPRRRRASCPSLAVDDRVGLHELGDAPGEHAGRASRCGVGCALRHDAAARLRDVARRRASARAGRRRRASCPTRWSAASARDGISSTRTFAFFAISRERVVGVAGRDQHFEELRRHGLDRRRVDAVD